MMMKKHLLIGAAFSATLVITGCQSNGSAGHVPAEYFSGTTLDRNSIGVSQHTEYLEVQMDDRDTQLRVAELMKVRAFLDDYTDVGHGPLVVSMPHKASNPQLAVGAVAEVRQLAWEAGVGYEKLLGASYDAEGRASTPLIIAYKTYKAIAPKCKSLAEIDVTNAVSNSDLPSLGCAIRTNMAAMIAEPSDLLGGRELDEGDLDRRSRQLELWRTGETTAAARSDAESAVVSNAVN